MIAMINISYQTEINVCSNYSKVNPVALMQSQTRHSSIIVKYKCDFKNALLNVSVNKVSTIGLVQFKINSTIIDSCYLTATLSGKMAK